MYMIFKKLCSFFTFVKKGNFIDGKTGLSYNKNV